MDPFFGASTLAINCDVLEPLTYQPYNRDPRTTAKKAEAYVKSTRHRRQRSISAPSPNSSSSTT